MKSKKYPNLHKVDWTPNWVYRKYSSQKRREFVGSTGILATDRNAPAAYKKGVQLFNDWLGVYLPSGREILIRDFARALLVEKENSRPNTYRNFRNQIENHVNPAFGHFRPDQITVQRWRQYDSEERRKGQRTKLFNTRKALVEILSRAKEGEFIHSVPKLPNLDGPAAPPRYIPHLDYLRIRRALSWNIKLLAFVMYHQGGRPSEVLQYRISMIDWTRGKHGVISIPEKMTKTGRARTIPLNSRVSRIFKWLKNNALSGDCLFPSRSDPDRPLGAYNAVWDRAMACLGFNYTIYNLRDTYITNQLKRGISSTFIGRYCDTSPTMIDRKYAVAEESIMIELAD